MNISEFGLIEEGAVKGTRNKIIRLAVVLTTMVAWFSISNHCAVGGLIAKANSAVAPMHCQIQDWIVVELISAAETQLSPLELDTGPPFAGSFAESVLQRSILAHAPPSLV